MSATDSKQHMEMASLGELLLRDQEFAKSLVTAMGEEWGLRDNWYDIVEDVYKTTFAYYELFARSGYIRTDLQLAEEPGFQPDTGEFVKITDILETWECVRLVESRGISQEIGEHYAWKLVVASLSLIEEQELVSIGGEYGKEAFIELCRENEDWSFFNDLTNRVASRLADWSEKLINQNWERIVHQAFTSLTVDYLKQGNRED